MLYVSTVFSFHFVRNGLAHYKRNSSNKVKYILCGQSGDFAVNQTYMLLTVINHTMAFQENKQKFFYECEIILHYLLALFFCIYSLLFFHTVFANL